MTLGRRFSASDWRRWQSIANASAAANAATTGAIGTQQEQQQKGRIVMRPYGMNLGVLCVLAVQFLSGQPQQQAASF